MLAHTHATEAPDNMNDPFLSVWHPCAGEFVLYLFETYGRLKKPNSSVVLSLEDSAMWIKANQASLSRLPEHYENP